MSVAEAFTEPLALRCRGVRKADGAPCRTRAVGVDGWCSFHRPVGGLDPVEMGRNGGLASGEARRAQSLSARERLRRLVDEDEELWGRLRDAYRDGLTAVDGDGNPDHRARVSTASQFLDQAYGKVPAAIVADLSTPLAIVLQELPAAELPIDGEAEEVPE
jgi:hypothetical protein